MSSAPRVLGQSEHNLMEIKRDKIEVNSAIAVSVKSCVQLIHLDCRVDWIWSAFSTSKRLTKEGIIKTEKVMKYENLDVNSFQNNLDNLDMAHSQLVLINIHKL